MEQIVPKPIDIRILLCYRNYEDLEQNVPFAILFSERQVKALRERQEDRKKRILSFIQEYYLKHDRSPSERDITAGTGIPLTTVHRFLSEMKETGQLTFEGRRSVYTDSLDYVRPLTSIPVLGYVACGPGQAEEEQFLEFIRMPEKLVGKGDFYALIAKGESMKGAGIHPGDYVIVRKQHTASNKDIVVALLEGKNNLKKLIRNGKDCILRSCNRDKEAYPDIIPETGEELQIQGVAVGVYHQFEEWN